MSLGRRLGGEHDEGDGALYVFNSPALAEGIQLWSSPGMLILQGGTRARLYELMLLASMLIKSMAGAAYSSSRIFSLLAGGTASPFTVVQDAPSRLLLRHDDAVGHRPAMAGVRRSKPQRYPCCSDGTDLNRSLAERISAATAACIRWGPPCIIVGARRDASFYCTVLGWRVAQP